jgi:hypothetical protein
MLLNKVLKIIFCSGFFISPGAYHSERSKEFPVVNKKPFAENAEFAE